MGRSGKVREGQRRGTVPGLIRGRSSCWHGIKPSPSWRGPKRLGSAPSLPELPRSRPRVGKAGIKRSEGFMELWQHLRPLPPLHPPPPPAAKRIPRLLLCGMRPGIPGITPNPLPELSKGLLETAAGSGCPGQGEQVSMWTRGLLENFYPLTKAMESPLLLLSVLPVTSGPRLPRSFSLPNIPVLRCGTGRSLLAQLSQLTRKSEGTFGRELQRLRLPLNPGLML